MNHKIKKMLHSNISEVINLSRQGYKPINSEIIHHYIIDNNSLALCIYLDTIMIGYTICYLEDETRILIIDDIVINENNRNNGYGGILLNTIIKACNDQYLYKTIYMKVKEDNLIGQLFLQSHGFKCVDIMKRHYQTNENAYLMELQTTESYIIHDGLDLTTN